ncbi:circularly permuted type 2 ATP-grasp protein [Sulfurospirillum sp. 1612]|uniref:circularly permuted type 2 ATP-grasp protein n=1 Tax=Sulfurospirillum sp. 1612 TaxID=3094835 RepID=UPI002F939CB3
MNEMYDHEHNINEHWRAISEDIERAGMDVLKEKQNDINWYLEDNGVTFNIHNSTDIANKRTWNMDPIPFVIANQEWEEIKIGLKQRAKLFNLIFKDLYAQQRLIKENIIPAEVIFTHQGYASEVFDFGFKEDFLLYFYAVDMARGPDGKMWVISDKTQAPSGLGYAIENRSTMNTISKDLYPDIFTKKLYPFIESYKNLLHQLSGGDISTAALLTSGPHNETYFEHSYLSSVLEINLVQGNDLLCKNGSVWLKSLSGLKKINTILRRMDDRYCDPLELKNDSKLGVAGLTEAMRQNSVNMINPIGSAILENVGLNPFMEKICEYFLGEKLILPQIATWWCGQKKELDFVLKNLDHLIIKKIDKTDAIKIYFGRKLSSEERAHLSDLLIENPHKYVAQEEISFSCVPYLTPEKIESRKAVVRAFCLKEEEDYSVMDGGLVRVSASQDPLMVSSQQGGTSKDLWILGDASDDIKIPNLLPYSRYVETSIDNISTPKAENLFWLGRYLSRSIATTRLINHLIKKIINFYRDEVSTPKESQWVLQNALTHMTMTYPGFLDEQNKYNLQRFPMGEIVSVIKEATRTGSLAFTFSMLANTNLNLKDLLAFESSKLFDKMAKEWYEFINRKGDSTLIIAHELDKFFIYLVAYKEFVRESIFKEQGLILYDIGYKIEAAMLLISKARSLLCQKFDRIVSHDVLEGMLHSVESFNAYRAIYRSSLTLEHVVDFLILSPQFPKSLTFITTDLLQDFTLLPKAKTATMEYEKSMLQAQELLQNLDVQTLIALHGNDGIYTHLDHALHQLSEFYIQCSDAFSNTYFSHYDEQ